MKIVSNELKNALKQPTTTRKGRILVGNQYYDVYNVEYYADSYDNGNVIGNAIASQLDFDLPYINKFDTFKYYDGVLIGNEYQYVDMGTFNVYDEKDEDEFNKHITAFDNLIKFNIPFVDNDDYPKTLYDELQNICEQAGVELSNVSIPNGDFIIENNQFVNNENLKSVLKAICGISGTYGIIKEDELQLQLNNPTDEIITKSEHEPLTWKRKTYGINQVIIGMEDVTGEYVIRQDDDDIELNGVHKLVINDNYFAYTQEKREQLIDALFEQVKGFGYVPYDYKGEWLNYLDIGDEIILDDIKTIVLRINGKSPKSLESKMSAPAIIDSAIEYVDNTNTIEQRMARTEFIADKNAQTLTGIVSNISGLSDELTNLDNTIDKIEENQTSVTGQITQMQQSLTAFDFRVVNIENNGVTKVQNTLVTIDVDGIKVATNESAISTLITNNSFVIKNYDEMLAQFNNDGAVLDNLTVRKYLTAGVHRREKFQDEETGEWRTGEFYVGGEI